MTDLLGQLPGYALRRAANVAMGELGDILGEHGFRVTEAAVLLLVQDIQRANMVPLLNRLEASGWIRREPIDGKSLAIVLTPEGAAKVSQLSGLIEAFELTLLERVPPEHRDHLLPALNAIWR